jgi:hypothetical protein
MTLFSQNRSSSTRSSKRLHLAPVVALVLFLPLLVTGCATTGAYDAATITNVELSEGNYEVVATNVQGEASAGYILGASLSTARQQRTIALARVSGSGQLYGAALEDLWSSFAAEHGSPEGRKLALTNVRSDTDALNLLLYTSSTVTIRADVVEFTDD